MNIIWNAARLAYAFGVGLCIRDAIDARRKAASPAPLPDNIEDQLDIMIHTTEVEEHAAKVCPKPFRFGIPLPPNP